MLVAAAETAGAWKKTTNEFLCAQWLGLQLQGFRGKHVGPTPRTPNPGNPKSGLVFKAHRRVYSTLGWRVTKKRRRTWVRVSVEEMSASVVVRDARLVSRARVPDPAQPLRVSHFGYQVSGILKYQGSGVRGEGFGLRGSGCGVRVAGFGLRGSGWGVRVSGFGLWGSV